MNMFPQMTPMIRGDLKGCRNEALEAKLVVIWVEHSGVKGSVAFESALIPKSNLALKWER